MTGAMEYINFWNGNKTSTRCSYEAELLRVCLGATESDDGAFILHVNNTDYPSAVDESNVLTPAPTSWLPLPAI